MGVREGGSEGGTEGGRKVGGSDEGERKEKDRQLYVHSQLSILSRHITKYGSTVYIGMAMGGSAL